MNRGLSIKAHDADSEGCDLFTFDRLSRSLPHRTPLITLDSSFRRRPESRKINALDIVLRRCDWLLEVTTDPLAEGSRMVLCRVLSILRGRSAMTLPLE